MDKNSRSTVTKKQAKLTNPLDKLVKEEVKRGTSKSDIKNMQDEIISLMQLKEKFDHI